MTYNVFSGTLNPTQSKPDRFYLSGKEPVNKCLPVFHQTCALVQAASFYSFGWFRSNRESRSGHIFSQTPAGTTMLHWHSLYAAFTEIWIVSAFVLCLYILTEQTQTILLIVLLLLSCRNLAKTISTQTPEMEEKYRKIYKVPVFK